MYTLIKYYHLLGFNQSEMLYFLAEKHGIHISIRTLKRCLRKMKLYRRKRYTHLEELLEFLTTEISKYGQLHGYKWMHLKCIQHGLTVTQETVRLALNFIDPSGVELRKKKRLRRRQYRNNGPNFLWYMDSYDKLKQYGIAINGCIDGFSRYVIWLKAGRTSSDPKVIAAYYLEAVKKGNGCPLRIRADFGTENGTVAAIHTVILEDLREGPHFISGRSTANQRIECWWSTLRKQNAQFWMNFFQIMKDDYLFDGSFLDKALCQFCFLEMIQKELNEVKLLWNHHRIRKSRNSLSPGGKPVIMYETPELYRAQDYKISISDQKIEACRSECKYLHYPCDVVVYELCNLIMEEENLPQPDDPYGALDLYRHLRSEINRIL